MTDTTGQPAWLTFDLGAEYKLDAARIWQYNVDFGMGYSLVRGAKDISLSISRDGVNFTTITSGVLDKGTGLPLAGQDFDLLGNARYVRLDLLNNYGDQYSWTGLSEVRFISSAVPEPEAWLMMIAGFGATGIAMRRRARAARHSEIRMA